MSDEGDNNFVRYLYRGEEDEFIPEDSTHIFVHNSVTVIREVAFCQHPNIIEVICHDNVKKIEGMAFGDCPSLRRVIMPGVTIVEVDAFASCDALEDVECDKLELIKEAAFIGCSSLRFINLPSVEVVEESAFSGCTALTDAKFGSKLERIEGHAFGNCRPLERITIPLKDGMITANNTFTRCEKLNHFDLVEGVQLQKTIAALQLEDWRNDMDAEINSINQILLTCRSGEGWIAYTFFDEGEKAQVIGRWIRTVLFKLAHYKAEHHLILEEEVATALELILPAEIMMNSVLPFLALPLHTFE